MADLHTMFRTMDGYGGMHDAVQDVVGIDAILISIQICLKIAVIFNSSCQRTTTTVNYQRRVRKLMFHILDLCVLH